MEFHEFKNGMTVMDDRRCVANARPVTGGWMLKVYSGCWLDPRARTGGIVPGKYPELMLIKTRKEARSILQGVTHAAA